jgi:hypothetical protein
MGLINSTTETVHVHDSVRDRKLPAFSGIGALCVPKLLLLLENDLPYLSMRLGLRKALVDDVIQNRCDKRLRRNGHQKGIPTQQHT